jgi:biopolymer transport protein ExbB
MTPASLQVQFSPAHYWAQGDAISHAVAYALLLMSLLSWYLILSKSLAAWRMRSNAVEAFWAAPGIDDALAQLTLLDRERVFLPLARLAAAQSAGSANPASAGLGLSLALAPSEHATRVLRGAILGVTQRLEGGLTVLASIGATAPFVGLLGTVWGIYHALAAVSASGVVQIDKVAGPVGEALIMTGLGLVVAIPAVLAYNGLNRVNRRMLAELDGFAHDVHAVMVRRAVAVDGAA